MQAQGYRFGRFGLFMKGFYLCNIISIFIILSSKVRDLGVILDEHLNFKVIDLAVLVCLYKKK